MSELTRDHAPGGGPAASAAEPSRRGRTVMSDGVVEKIAAQVVSEIGAAYGTTGGFLGIGAHADSAARPKVSAELSENSADLSISVGIAYPTSIRRATESIRAAVTARLGELTGIEVHRVDIDVAFLSVGDRGPGAGSDRPAPARTRGTQHVRELR